ncbi:MAG: ABC transporter ATP-binding protein/permease [Firmicutes bacterium]|jgi:ATP-binding cassette subfamily B protein|nr:ABC transporter ATP-binding protein/permease [Bacillota bacterium]MDH7495474.1 ABC transporter ATP-binding protein [Bacillota bacterium]
MIKLMRFLKPYRAEIALVVGLVFTQTISELYLPTLMSDIVNTGIMRGDIGHIWRVGRLMLLVALGGTACSITAAFLSARIAMGFGKVLRARIFEHVQKFSLREFDKIGTPSLITRNTNDVTQIQMVTMVMMRMMISAPIMCFGGIIMALSKDRGLARILAFVLPVLAATVVFVARKGFPLFRMIQEKIDRINLIVRENLSGIRVIRAFNRTDHERRRFHDANIDLTETSIRVNRLMALMMPTMMFIMNSTMIATIWFGSIRVDRGTLEVGNMMAFFQYAMQIMMSLLMASMLFIMIPRAQASADRITEVLAIEPEINDPSAPKSAAAGGLEGHVEFRDVTFRYHGAEEPAVRNVSFRARPGETVAIIGGTGSGKSTLVSLIPRFYDVTSGSVLVDGVDVRAMTQEELRVKIGFVPQKAMLFSGTVAENIRYGKEDATDEEVARAAKIAQAFDFICEMKDGFNSEIAQGGANLSGGQRQRLAIARALVRKPEIYIFDDSFSALDFKTDAKLRAALKRETAGSTVLIVAQRVSTVMDADRIVVLDRGRVVGTGTHKELLKTCEIYREIVASQLPEEEIA